MGLTEGYGAQHAPAWRSSQSVSNRTRLPLAEILSASYPSGLIDIDSAQRPLCAISGRPMTTHFANCLSQPHRAIMKRQALLLPFGLDSLVQIAD